MTERRRGGTGELHAGGPPLRTCVSFICVGMAGGPAVRPASARMLRQPVRILYTAPAGFARSDGSGWVRVRGALGDKGLAGGGRAGRRLLWELQVGGFLRPREGEMDGGVAAWRFVFCFFFLSFFLSVVREDGGR